MKEFSCKVYTPDKLLYEGNAIYVKYPLLDGYAGALYGHSPFVGYLNKGKIIVKKNDNTKMEFDVVKDGYIHIKFSDVFVLLND
jgi:F0F1-type ATP synthase epsilon subunit